METAALIELIESYGWESQILGQMIGSEDATFSANVVRSGCDIIKWLKEDREAEQKEATNGTMA